MIALPGWQTSAVGGMLTALVVAVTLWQKKRGRAQLLATGGQD